VDQLNCKFCGKAVKSKSGLTNHEKICPEATTTIPEVTTMQSSAVASVPMRQPRPERPERNGAVKNPFQFGAFLVMADYVPILLDVNFCIALGDHILEHGSNNSAIMAFAHQLKKLDED
jgi:hypothetical protein